jgi:hypothetical protein
MTETISERASDYMAAWFSRRPTFAFMGEYSSGKSALLNCILGRRLLPTRVTATDLPAVWITHGAGLGVWGLGYDGALTELTLDDLSTARAMQFLCIRIETDAEILQQADIIDTPGISDPRMTTAIVEQIARYIDFAVWCSPLNQAWRQTERAFWKSLPDRVKPASVLALTRADMMRSASDIEKVVKRCKVETAGSFAAVVPVAAPLAVAAQSVATEAERRKLLVESGIPILMEQLLLAVATAETMCEARPRLKVPAESVNPPNATKTRKKADASPPKRAVDQPKIAAAPAKHAPVVSLVSTLRAAAKDFAINEQELATIGHLFSQVTADKTLTAEHRDVLARALTVRAEFAPNLARVLTQVEHEIEDFADGPWCDIGR